MRWALAFLNIVAIVSATVGFLTVAVLTRIANVVPGRAKRARRTVLGDADCLTLPALNRPFPADGEIVVGERYRVDCPSSNDLILFCF